MMKIQSVAMSLVLIALCSLAWAQGSREGAIEVPLEREFTVGEGDLALPGTLALPEGEGPFPAVVLVHGSGPNDRDGTVGPNRPLRDIAHGLAAHGIASLRYDKRTRVHPVAASFDPAFDLDKEVTDDAAHAVQALRQTAEIDPERVFVFGHSLGAMMTPRIVQRSGAAGGIMLAASARSMLDLIPEQMERMAGLQGLDPAVYGPRLEAVNGLIKRIRAGGEVAEALPTLGARAHYLRDADRLDPVAEAAAGAQPLLILHGGADIQVTDEDWHAWEAAFAEEPRVTLKRYPGLGHLGIGSDPAAPMASYTQAGTVDAGLIADVANWIRDH